MNELHFWACIEAAWQTVGGKVKPRARLAAGKLSPKGADDLVQTLDDVIPALRDLLDSLPAEELLEFDRILERKLYAIDRAEIQQHTDGSDDGFLYARGFIVAAGQGYYDTVNACPSIAMIDLECEEMCYLSWFLYREKFGEVPDSGLCRESGTNHAGWQV